MSIEERKLPTGIQSFEKLREEGFVYVDKTEYIYKIAHSAVPFFLSRPRRFGKSLLLSTMAAYWRGKKELFHDLAIEKLEAGQPDAWAEYPVLYIDFNIGNYRVEGKLETILDAHLCEWEEQYGITKPNESLEIRFRKVIKQAHKKMGRRCVILVDEYDKPLLELMDEPALREKVKAVMKGFFAALKSCDDDIQFIFITGVSKFHKVSIFSDLNQLNDISLSKSYSGICGITEEELRHYFALEIDQIAQEQELSYDECLEKLKRQYDGYHFHQNGAAVYNPYSLINAFFDREFGSYWFESGTPTFLVRQLRNMSFDVRRFTDNTIYANASLLKDYSAENPDPIPLLYQTGYLTIADYDSRRNRYTLTFPNEEVKYGFLESLMPSYVPRATADNGLDIFTIDEYIETGEVEKVINVLTALFANITYTLETDPFEHYFQAVIYLVFTLLNKYVQCEMHTFTGRIDCRVRTEDYIYLFEFKRDESAEAALAQINDNSYALPFIADSRKLFKIGVSFDSEKRILSDWKVEE